MKIEVSQNEQRLEELKNQCSLICTMQNYMEHDDGRMLALKYTGTNYEMKKLVAADARYAMVNDGKKIDCYEIDSLISPDNKKLLNYRINQGYSVVGMVENHYADVLGWVYSDKDLKAYGIVPDTAKIMPDYKLHLSGLPVLNEWQKEDAVILWGLNYAMTQEEDQALKILNLENAKDKVAKSYENMRLILDDEITQVKGYIILQKMGLPDICLS